MTTAGKAQCPICSKPVNERYKPFCSKRCADVDLHRWLGEGYRLPVLESEDEISGADMVIGPDGEASQGG